MKTSAVPACTATPWTATGVFPGGQRASYNGQLYEAKWWTQGDRPDLSGEWGVWKLIGVCGGSGGGGGTADTSAPSVPAGLQASAVSTTSITLSWNASTDNVGVTGYTVFYGNAQSLAATGTTAVVNGLTSNTAYTFTVAAKDAAGNVSAPSSAVSATTTANSNTGNTAAWAAGITYKPGDVVSYGGKTYTCLQNHTSIVSWEPANAAALWQLRP
nr:carbohydrate-binding protein [Paenibacillus gorillae]